jgi:hypothetical protein
LPDVEALQRMVRSLAVERTALSAAQAEIERLHLIIKKLQRSQFGRRAEGLDQDHMQLGCGFRRMRPGNPIERGHVFRSNAATFSEEGDRARLPA